MHHDSYKRDLQSNQPPPVWRRTQPEASQPASPATAGERELSLRLLVSEDDQAIALLQALRASNASGKPVTEEQAITAISPPGTRATRETLLALINKIAKVAGARGFADASSFELSAQGRRDLQRWVDGRHRAREADLPPHTAPRKRKPQEPAAERQRQTPPSRPNSLAHTVKRLDATSLWRAHQLLDSLIALPDHSEYLRAQIPAIISTADKIVQPRSSVHTRWAAALRDVLWDYGLKPGPEETFQLTPEGHQRLRACNRDDLALSLAGAYAFHCQSSLTGTHNRRQSLDQHPAPGAAADHDVRGAPEVPTLRELYQRAQELANLLAHRTKPLSVAGLMEETGWGEEGVLSALATHLWEVAAAREGLLPTQDQCLHPDTVQDLQDLMGCDPELAAHMLGTHLRPYFISG